MAKSLNMDGKFKITKKGEIAFAGAVSGVIPVSGPHLPVDAEAEVDFEREWTVSNSGKLKVEFTAYFEMKK